VGDIYLALEKFDAAANAASVAIKLSPSMSAAHVLRVIALEGALRYDEALRAAERGLSQNPSHFGLHYERARMLRLVGKLADAEAAFKKCTSPSFYYHSDGVRPSSVAYAHNEYAALLSQLGRHEDARMHWRKSVEVDPSFAQGWVNAASHEDGLAASLAAYQRAVGLAPGLVEGWINIGQVYYNSFREDASYMGRALEAFERALAVAPESASALYSVARTRVDLCRWDGRAALFDEVGRARRARSREAGPRTLERSGAAGVERSGAAGVERSGAAGVERSGAARPRGGESRGGEWGREKREEKVERSRWRRMGFDGGEWGSMAARWRVERRRRAAGWHGGWMARQLRIACVCGGGVRRHLCLGRHVRHAGGCAPINGCP
jgi:hypothetical protein